MNDTWQPIETAPKDGTAIMVYQPEINEYHQERIDIVEWRAWRMNYPGCKKQWSWCVPYSDQDEQGGCETIDHPTHWMPLPKFPN